MHKSLDVIIFLKDFHFFSFPFILSILHADHFKICLVLYKNTACSILELFYTGNFNCTAVHRNF